MKTFSGYVCWSEADARDILATEALGVSDAAFLATHLPITDFTVSGSHAAEIKETTEEGLLQALADQARRHAFCVVEGEPGSGKSHLIRWLAARWEHPTDLKVLIQRADGSLEGTLDQLGQRLPSEFKHLFAGLGRRHEMTQEGRARTFLANLAVAMRSDAFAEPQLHSQWCDEWQLDTLLNNQVVQDNWGAPGRILGILGGRDAEHTSELAAFFVRDILELTSFGRRLDASLSKRSMRLLQQLTAEGPAVKSLIQQGLSEDTIRNQHGEEIPLTVKFVESLNARLNHAIQNLLGISASGLSELFRSLRRELKKTERRLVLLLEDVTNFQGVDNQLVDVLVTNSQTREDLGDLISVVGITPAYLRESMRANYLDRITHHVSLGIQQGGHAYQDVANLRNPQAQVQFAANYLRAVRAGGPELEKWARDEGSPVPNRCLGCEFREPCHLAFGNLEEVGLYPFTEGAIVGMFSRLEDPHGRMTHQTPRGMIQGVLNPTMLNPQSIGEGEFPSATVENAWLPETTRRIHGLGRNILAAHVKDPDLFLRMERLITLWGDQSSMKAVQDEHGQIFYAGLPEGVYRAFSLPWLGDGAEIEITPQPIGTVPPPSEQTEDKPSVPVRTSGSRAERTTTPAGEKKAPKVVVKQKELEVRRAQLVAWRHGQPLAQDDFWHGLCVQVLAELPWETMDVPDWIRQKFFTPNLVKIEGTGKTTESHFVIPAQEWLHDGLESLVELQAKTLDEVEMHRRRVARLMLQLRDRVLIRVRQLQLKAGQGSWNVPAAVAQVVATASWVNGDTCITDPLHKQWPVLLDRKENRQDFDCSYRSESWKKLQDSLKNVREQFVQLLLDWVTLVKADPAYLAPAQILPALQSLRESLRFNDAPEDVPKVQQWGDLRLLSEKVRSLDDVLARLPRIEQKRLHETCEEINANLRSRSLDEHVKRINRVCEEVGRVIPVASPRVREWHQQVEAIRASGYFGDQAKLNLIGFVDDTLKRSADESSDLILAWAQRAPSGPLRQVVEAFRAGERVIQDLLAQVQLAGDPTGLEDVSLVRVHEAGQAMQRLAESLLSALRKEAVPC